jgi:cell wall-associated NlpC family hydrolase
MSRVLPLIAALALFVAPAAASRNGPQDGGVIRARARTAQATPSSWAQREIRLVVSHGLMAKSVATFHPNAPLTQAALNALVAELKQQPAQPSAAGSTMPVTVAQLDARLVRVLNVTAAASEFASEVRRVGLAPPRRFGTEVVARLLGLRVNHPANRDDLELLPSDPVTRAETAYSVAQILRFRGWETQSVADDAAAFALPQLGPWQKRVLQTAVHFIGFPYVWGGTSENPEAPFGVQARGGFDCSGFVWRVYKLQSYPGGAALASTLRGRTTYTMSGEVSRTKRISFAKLQPGDVLFFGSRGPRSSPAQVDHTGIYLGGGWLIHSSGYGVALAPMEGWYRSRFAWARRPLAEARLGR